MKNILISALGGSLFPYLHNQLKKKYNLFYIDADEGLKDLYPDYQFIAAPLVGDEKYIPFLKNLIEEHQIDVYIPLIDEEIEKAHLINDLYPDLILISPTLEFSEKTLHKYNLMLFLDKNEVSSIPTWNGAQMDQIAGYPVFVKPIFGRGSRGIRKINSQKEFDAYVILEKYNPEDILVQELVVGQEYTVGVLTNNRNDILCISSKKVIKKQGITKHAVTENAPNIEAVVKKINDLLLPAGPYNVQLFVTPSNEIKIFEINPRFSTTSIMSFAGGVDEVSLYLDFYDKEYNGPIIRPKENLFLRRSWKNNFYV